MEMLHRREIVRFAVECPQSIHFTFPKRCKLAREFGGQVIAVSKHDLAADYGLAKRTRTDFVGKIQKSRVLKSASGRALSLACIFIERSLSGYDAIPS
jgi:hypothetical protein